MLNSDTAGDYMDERRTDFNLIIGQDYYFQLIPDYGYQIVGLNINGYTVAPQETVGVFKFTMRASNFHFQGIVSPASNQIKEAADMLDDLAIEDNYAEDVKGNLKLSATDAEPDSAALNTVPGEMFGTVDLKLDQIISKGNEEYWESSLSELSDGVKISFTIPAGELSAGQTYKIVREHEGVYRELDATYDAATEKLTFVTDKFSKYTVVKAGASSPVTPEPEPEKKESAKSSSSSGEQSAKPVYVPQPLGDVVGGKAIYSWNDLDKVLDTKAVADTGKTAASANKSSANAKQELVQLKLRNTNATVPASTFAKLAKTNYSGLHIFTGNGTAVTFMNDVKLAEQKAVNIGCKTVSLAGKKVITFNAKVKLNATTLLHATVPAGTKFVSVYFTGADGKRIKLFLLTPTAEGRLCFPIQELGKYELEY